MQRRGARVWLPRISHTHGGVRTARRCGADPPPRPPPSLLPLPCRGRVGVGVASGEERRERPLHRRSTPLPASPLSREEERKLRRRVPLLLPLPCRGRAGVGVASGGERRERPLHRRSTPLPTSSFFSLSLAGGGSGWGSRRGERGANGPSIADPPPSRPPPSSPSPLQGEGRGGGRAVREEEYERPLHRRSTPLPASPFSSPSPLQGEGRGGGRAGGREARTAPPSPIHPPPGLPPVQGGGAQIAPGSGWGSRREGNAG